MDHDLSPPWTSLIIVKAIKSGLFTQPPAQHTIERNIAFQMVNDGLTYQEQSWVPNTPKGAQLVFIPAARVDNYEVTAIIEEHKLFFNLCIIALMFMQEPQLHTTWDVCWSVQPNTHDVDQGICDALAAPTTDLNDVTLNFCTCRYIKLWWHQVPVETSTEWSKQGELFKDILQRVILTA